VIRAFLKNSGLPRPCLILDVGDPSTQREQVHTTELSFVPHKGIGGWDSDDTTYNQWRGVNGPWCWLLEVLLEHHVFSQTYTTRKTWESSFRISSIAFCLSVCRVFTPLRALLLLCMMVVTGGVMEFSRLCRGHRHRNHSCRWSTELLQQCRKARSSPAGTTIKTKWIAQWRFTGSGRRVARWGGRTFPTVNLVMFSVCVCAEGGVSVSAIQWEHRLLRTPSAATRRSLDGHSLQSPVAIRWGILRRCRCRCGLCYYHVSICTSMTGPSPLVCV